MSKVKTIVFDVFPRKCPEDEGVDYNDNDDYYNDDDVNDYDDDNDNDDGNDNDNNNDNEVYHQQALAFLGLPTT